MRTQFYISAALLAITPAVAHAQVKCERDGSGRITGTVIGAGVGAVAGSVIAGRNDNTEGAIIGGVIGAIAGNQIAKGSGDNCRRAYGWYDRDGRWYASGISERDARGYFDRDGRWIEGRPRGYYQNGQWVSVSEDGYWDGDHYVPANAYGYYDRNGRWVQGASAGRWENGRWIAGPARGYYDNRGRWIAGNPPYNSSGSAWSDQEQPGYYDARGRWVAGRTYGYYDSRGRWVETRQSSNYATNPRDDNDYGSWTQGSIDERIARIRRWVNRDQLGLSASETQWARREVNAIDQQHRAFEMSGGRLTVREEARLDRRLDGLSRRIERARIVYR